MESISTTVEQIVKSVRPLAGVSKLLHSQFPALFAALTETYFSVELLAEVTPPNHSRAGYMLAAAIAAERVTLQLHGQRRPQRCLIDAALANEVRYHWLRGRRPARPCAYLYTCLLVLPRERPERIFDAGRNPTRARSALPAAG